ncbi:MFS transporter [Dietzia cercidiphylli]|uniref:MFS transporter n=1 Tax=Dietzia cercidiphylli TaxID=498199 RepID=UPI003F7D2513
MVYLARILGPLGIANFFRLMMALGLVVVSDAFWLVGATWTVIDDEKGVSGTAAIIGAGGVGIVIGAVIGGSLLAGCDALKVVRWVIFLKIPLTVLGLALVVSGVEPLWVLAAVAIVDGFLDGLLLPAINVLFPRYVDPELLVAANGIENAVRPILAQALVPLLGSLLVVVAGPVGCLFAAVPALAVAALFVARIDRAQSKIGAAHLRVFGAVSQAVRQFRTSPRLSFGLIGSLSVIFATSGPLLVVLPVALFELKGIQGAVSFAVITSVFGAAAAIGALAVAPVDVQAIGAGWLVGMWVMVCLPLCLVGLTPNFVIWLLSAGLVGLIMGASTSIWAATVQYAVPDSHLKEVSSFELFLESLIGPISVGSCGILSTFWSARTIIGISSVLPLAIVTFFIVCAVALRALRAWRSDGADH